MIIQLINYIFFLSICASWGFYFTLSPPQYEAAPLHETPPEVTLPKNPFALELPASGSIENGPFKLPFCPPTLELPNLSHELQYLGKNERPDVKQESKTLLHIGLKSSGLEKTLFTGEKCYLSYKRVGSQGTYFFSSEPTSLWFECSLLGEETLSIKLKMIDKAGSLIISPDEFHEFIVKADESKAIQAPWEIGRLRADSSFLVRQHARFIGKDLFLELHGGADYAETIGRERLDFLNQDSPYSCFIKEGDFLIWKDEKWQRATPSEKTPDFSLLVVKKIDDKIVNFELWDQPGKNKISLSLVRTRVHESFPDLEQEFKFIGAKTWAQLLIECRGKREEIRPNDWMLLTREGWHKIQSAEEVDLYVLGHSQGPLFIFDKMTKHEGQQALRGHLFNTARTEVKEIILKITHPVQPLASHMGQVNQPVENMVQAREIHP